MNSVAIPYDNSIKCYSQKCIFCFNSLHSPQIVLIFYIEFYQLDQSSHHFFFSQLETMQVHITEPGDGRLGLASEFSQVITFHFCRRPQVKQSARKTGVKAKQSPVASASSISLKTNIQQKAAKITKAEGE